MVTNVTIGRGLTGRMGEFLPANKKIVTITDSEVYSLYGDRIDSLGENIVIDGGEECKTLSTIEAIHTKLIAMGADRNVFLLGFGGGIVTDIAGFAAATYLRGVGSGFVATTLLAQVDASVGGKNGVNVGGYKNMAGTFRQPAFVVCDIDLLNTLPEREFRAGLAEMIKAGVIGDVALFELIENSDLRHDKALLISAIKAAVELKARIVETDETEQGERRKLNLGHTFGHAIEKLTREFNHGEAVAIGMMEACRVSRKLGLLDATTAERIRKALERQGLSVKIDLPREQLLSAIAHDKKADGGEINFVLPLAVGLVEVRRLMPEELF